MTQAGWKDDPLFGQDTFDRIHTATAGVPRRINRLCDRLLLFGALEQIHELEGKHVDTVVAEISSELGIGKDDVDVSQPYNPVKQAVSDKVTAMPAGDNVVPAITIELLNRINRLEAQVDSLKKSMSRQRNLIKAALFEDDDDADVNQV
jgi:hypothetical protein